MVFAPHLPPVLAMLTTGDARNLRHLLAFVGMVLVHGSVTAMTSRDPIRMLYIAMLTVIYLVFKRYNE